MTDVMEVVRDGAVWLPSDALKICKDILMQFTRPTGPKSMRNSSRPGSGRLMGQISKAMNRSGDSVLHRVRPQQGTERINMHNRGPPKGPRGDINRIGGMLPNGRGMVNGGRSIAPGGPNNGPAGPLTQMTPQQQMQLMAMYEE